MRVKMDIVEEKKKTGMFSSIPVHVLVVQTELTEVEKAAIQKTGIGKRLIYSWPMDPAVPVKNRISDATHFEYSVDSMLRPETRMMFNTRIEAQEAMQELEKQFPIVKQAFAAADAPTSKTLDL